MLNLPMASATENLMAHRFEPPMDPHWVFLMGSLMAATMATLMVTVLEHQTARVTQFHWVCSMAHSLDPIRYKNGTVAESASVTITHASGMPVAAGGDEESACAYGVAVTVGGGEK